MPKKKTHDEFATEVDVTSNSEYRVIGRYVNGKTPVELLHATCGRTYTPTPKDFLAGKSTCRYCSTYRGPPSDSESFRSEVETLTEGEYSVMGSFVRAMEPVLLRHNVCKHEFLMNPTHFRRGRRCPKCGGTKRKTHDEFVRQVEELEGDAYSVVGRYVNADTKIAMRHERCGREYLVAPAKFVVGRRCPLCFAERRQSLAVQAIQTELRKNGRYFREEYWDGELRGPGGGAMRFDFFLHSDNLAVEYDGEQHFNGWLTRRISAERERDSIKNAYCIKKGIRLLRIGPSHISIVGELIAAALQQGSETIENLGAYYYDGSRVFNETSYYTSQREDYFQCE